MKMDARKHDIIVTQYMDNPLTEFAQFKAELSAKGPSYAGKIAAQVNMTTLIGGFARFRGTEAQQRACARFRHLHEQSQVGGARAVDPSREPVDGGYLNPEGNIISGEQARRDYLRLTTHLGRINTSKLEFVVIGEWGPTPFAKHWYRLSKPNDKAVSRAMVEVRRIADMAAEFLQLQTKGASAA